MLNHLEAEGLIERHVDPTNRRVVHVVLTEQGRVVKAGMERKFKTALKRVFARLNDGQLADLIAAFGHLEGLVDDAASIT